MLYKEVQTIVLCSLLGLVRMCHEPLRVGELLWKHLYSHFFMTNSLNDEMFPWYYMHST